MKVLNGKQGVLSVLIDAVYYPVLCAIDVAFQFDHEEVLKTTRTSSKWRERDTRLSDWGINLTGLTKVDNSDGQIGFFWLLTQAGSAQSVRLRYTDDDGNIKNVFGDVLVKQGQLTSVVGGFSTASLFFPGTGPFSTDTEPGVTLPVLFHLYLTTTEGAYEVSHADLGGSSEIMLVLREDGGYTEIDSGTPVGREFKFTDLTTSGKLTFDSTLPFNPGEIVYVQFMKIP